MYFGDELFAVEPVCAEGVMHVLTFSPDSHLQILSHCSAVIRRNQIQDGAPDDITSLATHHLKDARIGVRDDLILHDVDANERVLNQGAKPWLGPAHPHPSSHGRTGRRT